MSAPRRTTASRFLALAMEALVLAPALHAAQAPVTNHEVARAIERGAAWLREGQSAGGTWTEPSQAHHVLGMTSLAGLALLENGASIEDPAIDRARAAARTLEDEVDQTYDLSLAVLLEARLGHGSEGADRIATLASRIEAGGHEGIWHYNLPRGGPDSRQRPRRKPRVDRVESPARDGWIGTDGDHSNTQFALLGLWAAGRHGFDPDPALESIDVHFRSAQANDGGWGYREGTPATPAMTCAGLLALAITAARPSLAEHQTARARGQALMADPAFRRALAAVGRDARQASVNSDIYYLWSLERVCVALGLRDLDGFDWYAQGARILLDRQESDGGWPHDRWGRMPSTALALLFLRKANLAFELDRVLRVGPVKGALAAAASAVADQPDGVGESQEPRTAALADDVQVVVTGASDQHFPRIAVQFEVKGPNGEYRLDANRDDFRVTEDGRSVKVVDFQSPGQGRSLATTVVLVVDRSLSMENEDRIGGLKRAVATFLDRAPEGSRIAVVAFGSEVRTLCRFTSDRREVQAVVDQIEPSGSTRFHDAVAVALGMLEGEQGRRSVLALTDGEDTSSEDATLADVIARARRLGLPVHTLGLGSEDEIETGDLERLAKSTRGQYYPAQRSSDLGKIYEQLAERIGSSYTLVYESDRPIPDGTLRPVRIAYRRSRSVGQIAVFIPGMVAPVAGWSPLFLFLVVVLVFVGRIPRRARGT